MGVAKAIEVLSKEWDVISGAPISFLLAVIAVAGVIALVLSKWHARVQEALKAENHLLEQKNKELQTEADGLSKELEGIRRKPQPREGFGSEEMKSAITEIITTHSIKFLGSPIEWSDEQLNKFALFTLLHEAGHAQIQQYNVPPQATVLGTATTSSIYEFIKDRDKK